MRAFIVPYVADIYIGALNRPRNVSLSFSSIIYQQASISRINIAAYRRNNI